jgi:hypothetical protein
MHVEGVEVYFHSFITWELNRGEWSSLCCDHFTPGKVPHSWLTRRLGVSLSWCGCLGQEKNPLLLPEIKLKAFSCTAHSIATVLATQPHLYSSSNETCVCLHSPGRHIFLESLKKLYIVFTYEQFDEWFNCS